MPVTGDPGHPLITSARNPRVMTARSLHRRQGRRRENLMLLEGPHLVQEALTAGLAWHSVFYTAQWAATEEGRRLLDRVAAAAGSGVVFQVTPAVLEAAGTTRTPQGVVAVAAEPPAPDLEEMPAEAPILCLDGLQDPGNVGAALRSAYALGAGGGLLGPGTADPYQPKALRAGAGMMLRLPLVISDDLPPVLAAVRAMGRRVMGLTPRGGTPLPRVRWEGPGPVLVVGSEGAGISPAVGDCLDERVTIPLRPGAESLNAAAAATIALYELARRGAGDPPDEAPGERQGAP